MGKGWHQGFKEADADKDMHLNAEELEFLFHNAKKQHRDELVEAIEESAKSVLEGWDTDKDGKISLMELWSTRTPIRSWPTILTSKAGRKASRRQTLTRTC